MKLFSQTALTASGWQRNVELDIAADGMITAIESDLAGPSARAEVVAGPLLPGMVNLHSHAFQRAMAGLSEWRGPGDDSFWTWRDVMYGFVAQLTPEQVGDIAAQLYVEMLKAGYTAVGEFHYLHHDANGAPYAQLTEMSDRVIGAAHHTGIAITHLPVLYGYGGFDETPAQSGQRRFINDPERYCRLLEALFTRYAGHPNTRIGVAPHSLRAVTQETLTIAIEAARALDATAPVHLHIAEQANEVLECIACHGARPVAWLFDHVDVDSRWCLIHATHVTPAELAKLAASHAVVGLCPTTEANLGDGFFPAREYLQQDGRFGIGSDSHASISPVEELRLLEYGQRLLHQRRAVLAEPSQPHVGDNLYARAAAGGAQALGLAAGTLTPGKRADLVVLDPELPTLLHKPMSLTLDAALFAGNITPVRDVMVGGTWVINERRHREENGILESYRTTMRTLQTGI